MQGILLVNLGTPDAPDRGSVFRYLRQFLSDRRVIDQWAVRELIIKPIVVPIRAGASAKLYQKLWTENGSPLKFNGIRLAEKVQKSLGENYAVELAMRYQSPSIESAIERLLRKKVQKITVFPLFPQYASASTGSAHEEVMRVLAKYEAFPEIELIGAYPTWPAMIRLFADNARNSFDVSSYDHILFSYHGLPQRQMRNADLFGHCKCNFECCQTLTDVNQHCYSAQCYATTRTLVDELKLTPDQYTVSFQSRLGNDPWLKPYTVKTLENLAKVEKAKRILVFCPAFVSDCLETTIEISDEYASEFIEWGGETVDLVPSLNDSDAWAEAIAGRLRQK
jgi:protoporphyrin/coproporphyrin ferrochelatase